MKLKIGEKELNIKFGYKPTLKERIVSRIVKISGNKDKRKSTDETVDENEIENTNERGDNAENLEQIEDLLLLLPEILLVGLQVHHEEYRYNYDTKEGKEEQLDKVFDLVDEYTTNDGDLMKLFNDLQEEMRNDSFLASIFRKEEVAENAEESVQKKPEEEKNEN